MKFVPLNEIFNIKYGNRFDLNKMDTESPEVNFVSRSSQNLGVVAKVSRKFDTEPYPSGLITVTLGGTYLLSSFVQQELFYTAQNIKVLTPKKEMRFNEKIYYCLAIRANRFRYTSHGREANITLDYLLVPSKVPMRWINQDVSNLVKVYNKPIHSSKITINYHKWNYFKFIDLFNIEGSITTPLLELEQYGSGKYPYVTTQATNNGVEGFYNFYTEDGGALTVDSAVLGYCSYQPYNFSASDHVEKLIPKFKMNKYIAMFLVTILNQEQYRYNYGRKCSQDRMEKGIIKLPSKNGSPDWEFMENYIKSLPYSSNLHDQEKY